MKNPTLLQHDVIVPAESAGSRLDKALVELFPSYSRSRLQNWIENGQVLVDGKLARSKDKLVGGESIVIKAELPEQTTEWSAQKIDLPIIYEDDELLIINKPVGMVVHPAAGNQQNTMANALLDYLPQLAQVPRAGLIHRLDKETSGLLIVAKTISAQTYLVSELQARKIHREYIAVINGVLISGGTVNEPIGRHVKYRQRRTVSQGGKPSVTHYRVIERFAAHTLIKVVLETGRTHQIRVHMSHIGYPLLGDKTYGARPIVPQGASPEAIEYIRNFKHQALHARRLSFIHPTTKKEIHFEAPVPEPLEKLIEYLRSE
ncbi:MAG TPA: 23S rRNA pseudouridine(1911/1915/1917) synthase RluD [Gammaproteobacteria bacterium]|nr:23S rRNA pseudouridine(1911/1915/1917) synthase RluD [Gammaproteobacteria bacterium]